MALALGSVPVGGLTAFVALDYAARGWSGAGLATASFGVAFILVRLVLGGLPDRVGGAPVAAVSLAIELLGQLLLWLATTPAAALTGAAVTGLGFSLVFPALGVEAVKRVPPQNCGLAAGAYAAFFDVALGLTGPVIGAAIGMFGSASTFLAGAAAAGCAVMLILCMRRSTIGESVA
jgi:predicted MFS family arabinose efflux permease